MDHDTKEWLLRISLEESKYAAVGELTPGLFPRNEDSCYGKYGVCPFLDICRTVSDPSTLPEVPAGYVKERWEPFDTLGLEKLVNGDANETNKT